MRLRLLDPRGRTRVLLNGIDVAATTRARTRGLSGRRDIGPGMLFMFQGPTMLPFTVARMRVPIDIAWFDEQGRFLGASHDLVPGSKFLVRSTAVPYRNALEVLGGSLVRWGVGPGWKIAW